MDFNTCMAEVASLGKFGINLGLQRITELLYRLGEPQKRIPQYLHVTGTNGKGSVSAMCESMLRAGGFKTGFFSSPHLQCYGERCRINGQPMREEQVAEYLSRIIPVVKAMVAEGWESPTEFEVATAFGLLAMAEAQVDWAVVEVGMGGSIDSTNVIDAGLAVITNVSVEHTAYLGDTVEAIAEVKAGIIKPGATVLTAAAEPAYGVIAARAAAQQATLRRAGADFSATLVQADEYGQSLDIRVGGTLLREVRLPLLGSYQRDNAALAVAAAFAMGLDESAIRYGLQQVRWPARLEVLRREPLVVLDGAHNPDGIRRLVASLNELWPDKRKVALLGIVADKDRREMIETIAPLLSAAVVTSPPVVRAGDWRYCAAVLREQGVAVEEVADVAAACARAEALLEAQAGEMLICCGSLYMAADIRSYFLQEVSLC
ncbi:MAG: bifunctional folylpolyglutamate synthase/dihydrofolate synthase [Firmicutes bacterium]|nr:bifunctional folylpolyglutamate synthase/dihydrofolate synthase [Bacillota bacterium]